MFKNIRSEKIISMLLVIISFLSLMMYWNAFIIDAGSGSNSALSQGRTLYGANQSCVCAEKYEVVRPKNVNGEIEADPIVYTLQNKTAVKNGTAKVCEYGNGRDKISVGCNSLNGSTVMKKYVNAGIMSDAQANQFYNEASVYATYIQKELSTKTRTGQDAGWAGAQPVMTQQYSDLGNGRFQRAMFEFNNNAHFVYSFLIGFAFITAMLVFILIFMKITWLPDHPIKRREAMEDIVTSGVSVILTGGIWIFISLFQSIFDRFWSSYAVYSKDWLTVGNMFLYEYKTLVIGVLGVAALTALLMLIKNFVGLSFAGDNPAARKQKMISILFCGIATAGLGGLAIFMGFFWNMLN